MPTNPIAPQPKSNLVGAKTKRINFQTGDKSELENMQRNLGDRVDELLSFVQNNFSTTAPGKAGSAASVQAGSSQASKLAASVASSGPGMLSVKGQPSKVYLAPLLEGFAAATTIGTNSTTILAKYKPAGSTVTPTLDYAKAQVPFAGTVVGFDATAYFAVPTAGTYYVALNNTTQNKITALCAPRAYNKWGYVAANPGITFNAGDQLLFQLVVSGWTQGSGGGTEVRLWAQT